jgi:antitoxin component YwqK of YwqJK toxin-antitoxin module
MRFPLVVLMLPIFIDCAQPPEQVITSTWPDGSAKREVTIDHGDSTAVRTFYQNGTVEKTGFYDAGLKTGTWSAFYEDGLLWSEHHYYQDNQVGLYRTWHPNGQLFMEGSYSEQGNPTGTWTFKDDQGNTIRSLEGETLNP